MSSAHDLPVRAAGSAAPRPARQDPARTRPHLRAVPDVPLDFDAAVARLTPRLVRYADRRMGDRHEAEELVQEALLRAFDHRLELLTEDDLCAWATVVTGRLVIDRLRVRGRYMSVAEVPEGSRVGRDTADIVVARDEARLALDALDAMPGRQAAVLWAREVEGQGYDEIGQRFGMTEPAVRSILSRARKSLRKEYTARGGTVPVAGLAVLAPWANGFSWLGRTRRALARMSMPAGLGLVGTGLLGGMLLLPGSPGSGVATPAPALSRSAHSMPPVAAAHLAAPAAHAVAAPAAPGVTRAAATRGSFQFVPGTGLNHTCVSSAASGAGGSDCAPSAVAGTLYLNEPLPSNPTGAHYVGLSTGPVRCSSLPGTPVTACDHSTSTSGASR